MAEEKKERLIDEVEGVTKEEIQLFKHGTHGDTRRDVFREASGQLSDGAFENCRVGKCDTIFYGRI